MTASSLEVCSKVGRGSPLKRKTKRFACFGLVGVFLAEGEGVVCLGGGGELGSRGSNFGIGFCSGRGLDFCEGVDFPVNFINFRLEGGLGTG